MRKLFVVLIMIPILVLAGCTVLNGGSKQPAPKILRQTQIAGKYSVYQVEVTLKAGAELPLIIQMKDGDKADGYFYVEKGENSIGFTISGISQVYQSDMKNIPTGQPASDRFSFTATQAQGLSYTLTLKNTSSVNQNTSSTIFLEVIYAGNAPLYSPMGK